MYGISRQTDFVYAHDKNVYADNEIIIQTEWPHIVGKVWRFAHLESDEKRRQEFLKRTEGKTLVQSPTHRVYVEFGSVLADVMKSSIAETFKCDPDEYIRSMLLRMTEYVVGNLTPGQLFAYDRTRPIVPDDYYKKEGK